MANSVDPDQTAPIGAVCSGSTLFASIPNSSVMLGNYLQQTGPRCAVGNVSGYRCVSYCRSRGREFDPGPVPYFRGD